MVANKNLELISERIHFYGAKQNPVLKVVHCCNAIRPSSWLRNRFLGFLRVQHLGVLFLCFFSHLLHPHLLLTSYLVRVRDWFVLVSFLRLLLFLTFFVFLF